MNDKRIRRISQEIKKIVSTTINQDIEDPKVSKMTSISDVKVSSDLSYADIYISVLGTMWEKGQTMEGLENAKGFIKKSLASELKIRQIPEIRFHLDETIERAMYMDELIKNALESDRRIQEEANRLEDDNA